MKKQKSRTRNDQEAGGVPVADLCPGDNVTLLIDE